MALPRGVATGTHSAEWGGLCGHLSLATSSTVPLRGVCEIPGCPCQPAPCTEHPRCTVTKLPFLYNALYYQKGGEKIHHSP